MATCWDHTQAASLLRTPQRTPLQCLQCFTLTPGQCEKLCISSHGRFRSNWSNCSKFPGIKHHPCSHIFKNTSGAFPRDPRAAGRVWSPTEWKPRLHAIFPVVFQTGSPSGLFVDTACLKSAPPPICRLIMKANVFTPLSAKVHSRCSVMPGPPLLPAARMLRVALFHTRSGAGMALLAFVPEGVTSFIQSTLTNHNTEISLLFKFFFSFLSF